MTSKQHAILIVWLLAVFSSASSIEADEAVTYEAFGAVGDGVHDDLPAICEAHEYASARELPVNTKPHATYHLGSRALTAIIATDTDWNTSRFTIDDTEVVNHRKSLFEVRSRHKPETLTIDRLTRDIQSPLASLRFDPSAAPGEVTIEWIRVVNSEGALFKERRFPE